MTSSFYAVKQRSCVVRGIPIGLLVSGHESNVLTIAANMITAQPGQHHVGHQHQNLAVGTAFRRQQYSIAQGTHRTK